mmetsp:Transcript_99057/g.277443  ORF Transcript_99057/g.277443 Transcript_99057/m.277443 type:complete len:110 (-) Transcript_99057:375-704(-)
MGVEGVLEPGLVVSVKNTFIHCQLPRTTEALPVMLRRCTSEPAFPSNAQSDDVLHSSPTALAETSGRASRRRARPSKAKRRRWNNWQAAKAGDLALTHASQGLPPLAVA